MKIMVIYDSQSGNTEKMAKAVAEGATSISGVEVEIKKIGESFALSMIEKADGVIFGSPCIYANVTPTMASFLVNLKDAVNSGKVKVMDKKAAIFASYGYDGAYIMEDLFKRVVQDIGFNVQPDVCVEVDTSIQHHPDDHLEKCRTFGKNFSENL